MKPLPTQEDNFLWLLFALVFLSFTGSVFSHMQVFWGTRLVNMSIICTLLVAVWSMRRGRKGTTAAKWIATLFIAGLMLGESLLQTEVSAVAQLFAIFGFLVLTTYQAWQQVMFTGEIDLNKIVGAICIYMLIGLLFGFGYIIIEYFSPGSMKGLREAAWQQNLGELIYYSMITLTTLGYGDITPASPITRFLAYMEAITGVFYTTVLVASLIGLRLESYRDRQHQDGPPHSD